MKGGGRTSSVLTRANTVVWSPAFKMFIAGGMPQSGKRENKRYLMYSKNGITWETDIYPEKIGNPIDVQTLAAHPRDNVHMIFMGVANMSGKETGQWVVSSEKHTRRRGLALDWKKEGGDKEENTTLSSTLITTFLPAHSSVFFVPVDYMLYSYGSPKSSGDSQGIAQQFTFDTHGFNETASMTRYTGKGSSLIRSTRKEIDKDVYGVSIFQCRQH